MPEPAYQSNFIYISGEIFAIMKAVAGNQEDRSRLLEVIYEKISHLVIDCRNGADAVRLL